MRSLAIVFAVCACGKAPAVKAPAAPTPIDPLTSLQCDPLDKNDPLMISCAPGGDCALAYNATRITTDPGGYEVGDEVAVEVTARAWQIFDDGEHLHLDLVGTNVVVDAELEGAWGTEATVGHEYVGVARTIDAGAPAMAAVRIAGAPHTPTTTRDELRVAVRCALSTDLQE